jgi:hypothetical protein
VSNPFATEDAWAVGDSILPARPEPYLCTIREVDGAATSSGNFPQIDVKVGNADGAITDWIVVIPATIGKVVQLTDAAGLPRPTDQQVKPDGDGYRLHPDYLAQLIDKQVGVFVRSEPDRMDATKTRDRVKGYCSADKCGPAGAQSGNGAAGADVTWDFSGTSAKPQNAIDDDIPF